MIVVLYTNHQTKTNSLTMKGQVKMLNLNEIVIKAVLLSLLICWLALTQTRGKRSVTDIAKEMSELDTDNPKYKEKFDALESLKTKEDALGLLFVIPGIFAGILLYVATGYLPLIVFVPLAFMLYSFYWSRQNNQSTKYLYLVGRVSDAKTRKAKIRNNSVLVFVFVLFLIFGGLHAIRLIITSVL